MRQAQFRRPGNRDWGLPAFAASDVWSDLRQAVEQVVHHLLIHRLHAHRLRRYLAGHPDPVLLSLGSGRTVAPGWIGIDLKKGDRIFRCDLRKRLPLPDESVDGMLAEHVLEHFCLDDLPAMLAEAHRVLRPGAPLRIVSPDAAIVAALLRQEDTARLRAQIGFDTRVHGWDCGEELLELRIANRLAYQFGQHQVLLTGPAVARLLTNAGFTSTRHMSMTETVYFDEVPGTHLTRFPDSAHEALTVEAIRPHSTAPTPETRRCEHAPA